MSDRMIIGITGGSGSGKTHVLHELIRNYAPDLVCWLSMDNYYFPREQQEQDENGVVNFDRPEAIDGDTFYQDLVELINGRHLEREEYVFNQPGKLPDVLHIDPAPVILVEGIFILQDTRIRELLDLSIFVEASDHLMLNRRIQRDAKERGYDLEDVTYRFDRHVMPAYQKFTLPFRDQVDLIIPNQGDLANSMAVVRSHIDQYLEDRKKP